MKRNNGITLVTLVIYVIVMLIIVGVMTAITNTFYRNTEVVKGNVQEVVEFNKFNSYFLKEVKLYNNKVDTYAENKYILFTSGNSFSINNNSIYYNNIKICDGVQSVVFKLGKDGDGQNETIINVTLNFVSFNKSINYKLENIY